MKLKNKRLSRIRQIKASLRDSWLLLREFAWPLAVFLIAIIGGGLFYYQLSRMAGEPTSNVLAAIYQVLSLTFLQSLEDFPNAWYLELFYFLMPVIGVIILSQGVAEFGSMFFNRQQRSKEWETAVASTYQNHHILIGLGHLGFRVANCLYELGQDIVAIELNPSAELVARVKKMGIPVIQDNASRDTALEAAKIKHAKTIILCTQNDSLNLQIALKARRLNPKVNVVLRIFDLDFAQALQEQFGFIALSATQMAAPIFASAAAGIDMTQPISIEGQQFSLAKTTVSRSSKLVGLTIAEVEDRYDISVVLLRRLEKDDLHPGAQTCLEFGDILAILGGPTEISRFVQES